MGKPTKDSVLVESYDIKENAEWVGNDMWMTKAQLQNYADEIESEERIKKDRRRRSTSL